jgi:Uma2 family endonuclease
MSATAPKTPAPPATRFKTAADWLHALGDIPLERIVFDPPPGTATVKDAIRLVDGDENPGVELINKTLVEKPVGFEESVIASNIIAILYNWAKPQRRGIITGEQGMICMLTGNVRMPDAAFFRREDLPDGQVPAEPAPSVAPTLAVEVLSQGNTEAEMRIKLREYFESGTRMVWVLDPNSQTLRVHDALERFYQLTQDDTLAAGELLPGFSVRVGELFAI